MADPMPPQYPTTSSGWGPVGKVRNPWAVIGLSFITIGIYFLYWTYQVFREMKEHTYQGIGGPIGLLIGIFVGIVNVVPDPRGDRHHVRPRRSTEARERRHRFLEFHPARRLLHLGHQGSGCAQPALGDGFRLGEALAGGDVGPYEPGVVIAEEARAVHAMIVPA